MKVYRNSKGEVYKTVRTAKSVRQAVKMRDPNTVTIFVVGKRPRWAR